ncbi:MAG: hypothetical protein B1H40_02075 [Candidatus Latescibacteria bacterium 4484_181]|nr:MAG: hypothetical protein B1H40_02075 [Candidatus Latescibacteria bacterium 4484_181]RKY72985.1 MAG: hypothetical protein DRQ24_03665 [Candidatus Latescibacterota bacterium]
MESQGPAEIEFWIPSPVPKERSRGKPPDRKPQKVFVCQPRWNTLSNEASLKVDRQRIHLGWTALSLSGRLCLNQSVLEPKIYSLFGKGEFFLLDFGLLKGVM